MIDRFILFQYHTDDFQEEKLLYLLSMFRVVLTLALVLLCKKSNNLVCVCRHVYSSLCVCVSVCVTYFKNRDLDWGAGDLKSTN